MKVGRNEPCPCGSGKKSKKCCAGGALGPGRGAVSDERDVGSQLDHELERCSQSDPPDYHAFGVWLEKQLCDVMEKAPIVDPWEDWGAGNVIVLALERLKALAKRLDTATALEWRHFKLLTSAFSETPRSKAIWSFALNPPELNANTLADGLEDLNPVELRDRLFKALEGDHERAAFKILGRLEGRDHDDGELLYLEALCYFRAQDYANAIKYALLVPPNAVDRAKAEYLCAQSWALLGDVGRTYEVLGILAGKLTFAQYLNVTSWLCAHVSSDKLEDACTRHDAFVRATFGDHARLSSDDPAYRRLILSHSRLVADFLSRLREARDHLELLGETATTDMLDVLERACVEDERLRALANAVALVGDLRAYLSTIGPGHHGGSLLVGIHQTMRRPDVELLAFSFEVMNRLDDHNALIANYERIRGLVATWPERTRCRVLRAVYSSQVIVGHPEASATLDQLKSCGQDVDAVNVEDPVARQRLRHLSPMGRAAYRVAVLGASALGDDANRWQDAGMVALAFFRVLEHELSARLVAPALLEVDLSKVEGAVAALPGNRRSSWERMVRDVRPVCERERPGVELGPMEFLLGRVAKPPRLGEEALWEAFAIPIRARLTPLGVEALEQCRLAKLIDERVRQRFRNPPAHTRFVPMTVAMECRRYVDEALDELFGWLAGDDDPIAPAVH